jgi:hypothetical protein
MKINSMSVIKNFRRKSYVSYRWLYYKVDYNPSIDVLEKHFIVKILLPT